MMQYVGDTIGGAAQAYNQDQWMRRNAMQEALTRVFQARLARSDANRRQQQFQQEMGMRQQEMNSNRALALAQLGMSADRNRALDLYHKDEIDYRNRMAGVAEDREKFAEGGNLTPKQKLDIHLSTAQQDAITGDAPVNPDDVKQKYGINDDDIAQQIAEASSKARAQIGSEFGQEEKIVGAGSTLNRLKKIDDDTAASPTKTSSILSLWKYYQDPEEVVQPSDHALDLRRRLTSALTSGLNSGQIVQDSVTGKFSPASPRPSWYPRGNIQSVNPLEGTRDRADFVDDEVNRSFSDDFVAPTKQMEDLSSEQAQIDATRANTSAVADGTSTSRLNNALRARAANYIPAPPGATEGSTVRQKSTGKLFIVRGGQLVPYLSQ